MIEEFLERRTIYIYIYKYQSPPKSVNKGRIVFSSSVGDRAMQDDKRKDWRATCTPSQKHGLIEQCRMIGILERYIDIYKTNPLSKE